ncbi:MAG: hypothetical protein ACT4PT_00040, partial [Methanobacteriota archaeon]
MIAVGFALLMVVPGALAFQTSVTGRTALFSDKPPTNPEVEYGHTTYVALFDNVTVEQNTTIDFAAVASVSVQRTNVRANFNQGGVLWFNDSILFDKLQTVVEDVTNECMNNTSVHVVASGAPDPRAVAPIFFTYLESYRVTDPNGQTYVTDAYSYNTTGLAPLFVDFVTNTGACVVDPTLDDAANHTGAGED